MHALHEYLCRQLREMLEQRRVIVWYDPEREFESFIDRELAPKESEISGLEKVLLGNAPVWMARYAGSYFALRFAVEPIVAMDSPEPLIIYIPGKDRDMHGSVLMEMEKGGVCFEPRLKRLARNLLLQEGFSDVQIDEALRPSRLDYDDVAGLLRQGREVGTASLLRSIFQGKHGEALLARWLAEEGQDEEILAKEAGHELIKLIETRLGLTLPMDIPLSEARSRTIRYVLAGEFRLDLECDPPEALARIPMPDTQETIDHLRRVAQILRQEHPARYGELANAVERELGLQDISIKAECLGKIDTFAFEEKALLAHAGKLIAAKNHPEAMSIITGRKRSFWVDRDLGRQAQWEACRLMAELGLATSNIRGEICSTDAKPESWVQAYTAKDGWHRVDALQRRLETWVANMNEEIEAEQALAVIRRECDEVLKVMASGFAQALRQGGWSVFGVMHQTDIFQNVVKTSSEPTAYFLVDALRFEMGVELARQLERMRDIALQPALAALPTITPLGMAALLPGAAASFTVIEHKGRVAAMIENTVLASFQDRFKFLTARIPTAVELTLGRLLNLSASALKRKIEGSSLMVIRSQEIDFAGEMDGDLLARQVMDTVIGNLARAVNKLAAAGVKRFVVTADHGHQFSLRKDDDMKIDSPGGDMVEMHRRCWVGRGGATPPGTVRLSGTELGYATDLEFVFPTGLGVFKAGGGLCFHHGGVSLQEIIIPVLCLRVAEQTPASPAQSRVKLLDVPESITNRTLGVRVVVHPALIAETLRIKVVLIADNQEVGRMGMAINAELDQDKNILRITSGTKASVGLLLKRDDCASVRIMILDAETDTILDQTKDIPVKLGI